MNILKLIASLCLLLVPLLSFSGNSKIASSITQNIKSDIVLLDSSTYLYQVDDFYISGQPSDSIFIELKEKGLGLVINIRTPEEMEELKKNGFDEPAFLDSLGIKYVNIPMGGAAGYAPEMIKQIDEAINEKQGAAMIHCRSAGRATYAFVAWLINYQNMPVDDAITFGKKMRLRFTVEDLLGYELYYGKRE